MPNHWPSEHSHFLHCSSFYLYYHFFFRVNVSKSRDTARPTAADIAETKKLREIYIRFLAPPQLQWFCQCNGEGKFTSSWLLPEFSPFHVIQLLGCVLKPPILWHQRCDLLCQSLQVSLGSQQCHHDVTFYQSRPSNPQDCICKKKRGRSKWQ